MIRSAELEDGALRFENPLACVRRGDLGGFRRRPINSAAGRRAGSSGRDTAPLPDARKGISAVRDVAQELDEDIGVLVSLNYPIE